MLYSDLLKSSVVKKALDSAGVGDIESLALKDGDWSTDLTENDTPSIQKLIDEEILSRRRHKERLKKMADLDEKMKPFKKLEAKAEFIKPHFERLIAGKFAYPYSTLEQSAISYLSDQAAKRYDFDESGNVSSVDLSGLSPLEKLLKESSVTRLSHTMTPEEIALRVFDDGSYSSMLK